MTVLHEKLDLVEKLEQTQNRKHKTRQYGKDFRQIFEVCGCGYQGGSGVRVTAERGKGA
jgi:hypothetical protein